MGTDEKYIFPVQFEDVHYIAALYTANATKVSELLEGTGLKAGLYFVGKPLAAVGLIQYRVSDLGAYNEIILAIPVVRQNDKTGWKNWLDLYAPFDKRKGGQYIIHIPVTTQISVDAGQSLWGYPKILLPIHHNFRSTGTHSSLFNEYQQPILQIDGKQGIDIPIPAMNLMTFSFLQGKLLKTTVDVNCRMHWKAGSGLTIKVIDSNHPIGKDIIELGINDKKPLFTVESNHFKAAFNEGVVQAIVS
jgi:hypothetical protein